MQKQIYTRTIVRIRAIPSLNASVQSNKSDIYNSLKSLHCVKRIRIRSYSGQHFPPFGLNTERYEVSFRIQPKCEKTRTRITPNTDTFQAVLHTVKMVFHTET